MSGILFYDGECGLCNRAVRTLNGLDRHSCLRFEPLQGVCARQLLPDKLRDQVTTVVYHREGMPQLLRSDAILQALIDTGTGYRIPARLALTLPRALRDPIYRCIAKNRHRCPL
jgi:predicted DCC family thiol-disulfide oxidoreductase YuxK